MSARRSSRPTSTSRRRTSLLFGTLALVARLAHSLEWTMPEVAALGHWFDVVHNGGRPPTLDAYGIVC